MDNSDVLTFFQLDAATIAGLVVVATAIIEGVKGWLPKLAENPTAVKILTVVVVLMAATVAYIGPANLPVWGKIGLTTVVVILGPTALHRNLKRIGDHSAA